MRQLLGSNRRWWVFVTSLFLMLWASFVYAKLYKCVDKSGNVTYSQIPCEENQKTETIRMPTQVRDNVPVCTKARRFSELLAEEMRSGVVFQEHVNRYGGLDGANKSIVSMINDIHRYKVNENMNASAIAALIANKCANNAYNGLTVDDIPLKEEPAVKPSVPPNSVKLESEVNLPVEPDNTTNIPGSHANQKEDAEHSRKAKCDNYRHEVDRIDEKMRRGYSKEEGDKLRRKRIEYRKHIQQECRD